MAYRRKLRNIVIVPQFQWRFIAWFCLHLVILGGFANWALVSLVEGTYLAIINKIPFKDMQRTEMLRHLDTLVLQISAGTLLFVLILSISAIIFSHRVAGPLYKFKKLFGEVSAGNMEVSCTLRANDEFKDVAQSFNDMMASIRSRLPAPPKV